MGIILIKGNKLNKKLVIIEVLVAAAICFGLFAFILFAHSNSMLDHVTGLTLKQEGETIVAKWDKMKCKGYIITVRIDDRKAGKTQTLKNYYVLRNVKYNHEYQIKVEARMRQGTTSVAAKETIFTLQPQDIQTSTDVGEGFAIALRDMFMIAIVAPALLFLQKYAHPVGNIPLHRLRHGAERK